MLTIEQIEAAILELPPDKFHQLLEWFSELDYRRWDEQLEQDVASVVSLPCVISIAAAPE